ncbi:MAG: riboflavin biosynthesis protein RibF [Dehalococcoidia bacterium]|nr:riboflavin biosynthesis protein RibF [Dehalococcoidia bacterium]
MQVIHLDPLKPEEAPADVPEAVVTIGKFDGVHLGHHALLDAVVSGAKRRGVTTAVVVLDPHPLTILRPDLRLKQLTTLPEKLWLLARTGADLAVVWQFSETSALLAPEGFFRSLAPVMRVRAVVIGPGFVLGRDRAGDESRLRSIGEAQGFAVESIQPASVTGQAVRSTEIRALLAAGDVSRAAGLLDRPPSLHARVVEGDRRGRLLGFPTANLSPLASSPALPADGVYAGWVELLPLGERRTWHPAAANLGVRPTFAGRRHVVEAHLLDFADDLYGQEVRLHFAQHLRSERQFSGPEELQQQIGEDAAAARSLLASQKPPETAS